MKLHIKIAPQQNGEGVVRPTIIGNRGRLRWVGHRFLNDLFGKWQRLFDRVLEVPIDDMEDLQDQIAGFNAQMLDRLAELGAQAGILVLEYPAMGDGNAAHDPVDLARRIALVLRGLDGAQTTLHLTRNDPVVQRAIHTAQSQADGSPATSATTTDTFDDDAAWTARLNAALLGELPTCTAVMRPDETGCIDPVDVARAFLRDMGISPETMKLAAHTRSPEVQLAAKAILRDTNPDALVPARPATCDAASQEPLSIFFMVEPGPLEAQAHLLIASLMVNCRDDFQLVGFCRTERVADLHAETRKFLAMTGAELRAIENHFSDGYPAGNKLIAAAGLQAKGWGLFLDTDICLVRPSRFLDVVAPGRVSLCLDNLPGWAANDDAFQAVADVLGFAAFPRKQALWGGSMSHPTYNAGLVLFPPAKSEETDFGARWLAHAEILEHDDRIANKRPWLDTIALAGLAAKDNNVRPLSLEWNCTTRMSDETTRVLHYHGLRQLRQYGWVEGVDQILAASPSQFNSFEEFMTGHKRDMKLASDVEFRAMRHGLKTQKQGPY